MAMQYKSHWRILTERHACKSIPVVNLRTKIDMITHFAECNWELFKRFRPQNDSNVIVLIILPLLISTTNSGNIWVSYGRDYVQLHRIIYASEEKNEKGVGLILDQEKTFFWDSINSDKILVVKLKGKPFNISVIVVCA